MADHVVAELDSGDNRPRPRVEDVVRRALPLRAEHLPGIGLAAQCGKVVCNVAHVTISFSFSFWSEQTAEIDVGLLRVARQVLRVFHFQFHGQAAVVADLA